MSDLQREQPLNQVDPNRFSGKTFTRRNTFQDSEQDYVIRIDGLTAGRIMRIVRPGQRVVWAWFFHGPYYPHGYPHSGEEETLEAAGKALKKLFWDWHTWALKQQSKQSWYGAAE